MLESSLLLRRAELLQAEPVVSAGVGCMQRSPALSSGTQETEMEADMNPRVEKLFLSHNELLAET